MTVASAGVAGEAASKSASDSAMRHIEHMVTAARYTLARGQCQTNANPVAIAFLARSRKVEKTYDFPQPFGDRNMARILV